MNIYLVCVTMHPVDELAMDCEWILGLCNDGCGGQTTEYYLEGNTQSGGL